MEAERSREAPVTWGGISHSYPPAFSNRDSKRDAWAEVPLNSVFYSSLLLKKVKGEKFKRKKERRGRKALYHPCLSPKDARKINK